VGSGGYVKKVNLLSIMLITLSKIVVRVAGGVLDIYLSIRKDPKEIGQLWKMGDMILC